MSKKRLTFLLGEHGLLTDDWRVLPLARTLNAFLDDIPESRENTKRAYRYDLNFLLAFMQQAQPIIDRMIMGDLTKGLLQGFIDYRLDSGDAPSTVARRIGALKSFDDWFGNFVTGYPYPARSIRAPELQQMAFEGLEAQDIPKIIEAAYTLGESPETRLRNGLAVDLLFATGLRNAEVRGLTEGQLDPKAEWFRNVRCKGGVYRNVYVLSRVRDNLYRWMNTRERILYRYRIKCTAPYPILISTRGAQARVPSSFGMNGKTLWRIVAEAARVAKTAHAHPHKCRHSRAHEVLEMSKDVRLVQQALGHRSLQSTVGYTHRSSANMAEQLERAQRK